MTDITDVSRWGRFIFDEALKQKMEATADGVTFSVLLCALIVPVLILFALNDSFAEYAGYKEVQVRKKFYQR